LSRGEGWRIGGHMSRGAGVEVERPGSKKTLGVVDLIVTGGKTLEEDVHRSSQSLNTAVNKEG